MRLGIHTGMPGGASRRPRTQLEAVSQSASFSGAMKAIDKGVLAAVSQPATFSGAMKAIDKGVLAAVSQPATFSGAALTIPKLVTAAINAAGTLLTLTYSEPLNTASVPTLAMSGAANSALTGAVTVAGSTVTRAITPAVASYETGITVTTSGSPIQDAAGNNAVALTGQAVTNGSTTLAPIIEYGANLYRYFLGSSVTLNGSAVATWIDNSGKGLDGLGVGTAQPAYNATDATLGNQPTVTGDAVNDILTTAGLTVNLGTEDYYEAFVLKQITWVSNRLISSGTSATGSAILSLVQAANTPNLRQSASDQANTNTAATLGTWVYVEVFWSATPGASYLKVGSTLSNQANPGTGTRTSSTLFATPGAGFSNVAIADCIAVKTAAGSGGPTAAQRARVKAHFQAKFPTASF
jgi:hypothetical protein